MRHEELEQRELGAGEMHRRAVEGHARRARSISTPSIAHERRRRGRVRDAAQGRAHTREQLLGVERLRDVVVGAGVEGPDLLRLLMVRGEDDDRHRGERADAAQHLEAVDIGESEVEDDEVGRAARSDDDRFLAGGDVEHLEVAAAHHRAQRAPQRGIVFDEQDRGHAARASRGNVHTNVAPPPGVSS